VKAFPVTMAIRIPQIATNGIFLLNIIVRRENGKNLENSSLSLLILSNVLFG